MLARALRACALATFSIIRHSLALPSLCNFHPLWSLGNYSLLCLCSCPSQHLEYLVGLITNPAFGNIKVLLHPPASCTPLACPRPLLVVSATPSGHQVMYFPRVSLSFLSLWCPKRVPPAKSILQAYSVWHSPCCTACETFDNIGKLAFDELAIFPLWHPPAGAQ